MAAARDEIANQPPPFVDHDLFAGDRVLAAGLEREGGGWAAEKVRALARAVAGENVQDLARQANRHPPELRTHDRFGNRIDAVEFHPAWHELMALAFGHETHSLAWTAKRPGAHVARGALSYLWNQTENGVGCPVAMTFAAVRPLRIQPEIAALWEPAVVSARYDPRPLPVAEKTGATIGMTFTERQGGSDLRANATRAEPAGAGGPGGEYLLTGQKWFCSAPMSDAFFTLAYTEKGPSFFFVPRSLPDGTRNFFLLQRLKEKCGNRSNASSEVEFRGTHAWLVGEEGRGIRYALEMAHYTRVEIAIATCGIMRRALNEAIHHARHRSAFQRRLVDQPLMRAVLADLALEWEAALVVALRLARAADEAATSDAARLFERVATPVAKYWVCKRVTPFVAEAMECLGGNGYVEEAPLARLFREAPLNGIWEGSGNVICLDVLRALQREPGTADALLAELRLAKGGNASFDSHLARLEAEMAAPGDLEPRARAMVEAIALALQASLLIRHAPASIADAFCATRLAERHFAFGALPAGIDAAALVERAGP